MMNLASGCSYFCTYLQCWSENFSLWIGGGRRDLTEHVPRVVYETLKQLKLLNSLLQIKMVANDNYIMIRRAIFGKVLGDGVKEI